jgi:hypothetical protein
MGSTMLPPMNAASTDAPNMMGMNPQLYQNYMERQQNERLVNASNQIPPHLQQQQQQPQQQQLAQIGGMAQQQPYTSPAQLNAYLPQQTPNMGLASLPGAGQFGKPFV